MKRNFLTDLVGIDPLKPEAKFVDTAMVPDDDAPSFDADGYTAMRPGFAEAQMLEALESPDQSDSFAQLSPQQAYEHMKYQAPLSKGEKSILNTTPFLHDLSWVDDPDHDEWLLQQSKGKSSAMDKILEDQMYGEEPGVDASGRETKHYGDLLGDDESGFSFNPLHYVSQAAKGVEHGVTSAAKAVGKGVLTGLKDVGHVAKVVALWPAKKLEQVAKMVASGAAFPIKKAARPLVNSWIAKTARDHGRTVPTAADKQAGSRIAISKMIGHANPLVKFGGLVMKWVGTGVSGEPTVLGHDAEGSKIYGYRDIDLLHGGKISEVGFTGIEIAALAAASAIAIGLVVKKMMPSGGAAAAPAPAIDPATGLPMAQATDPATGLPLDPTTGQPLDPNTGLPMDPNTAAQYAAQQQAAPPQYAPQAPPQYDPNAYAQQAPPQYDPNAYAQQAPPQYDPNAYAAQPPMYDPNAYSSGDAMSNDETLETVIFGDSDEESIIFGGEEPGVTSQGTETESIFGADPAYDLVVGAEAQKPRSAEARKPKQRSEAKTSGTEDDSFAGFASSVLGRSEDGQKRRSAEAGAGAGAGTGPVISAEKYKALCIKRAQTTSGNDTPDTKALVAAHKHVAKKLTEKKIKVAAPAGTPPGTSSGAWLYKLNPMYWIASTQEQKFIDAEKDNYEKTKDLKKEMAKKADVLEAGRRAVYQAEQAKAAKQQADDVNTELKDIQESISSGAFVGSFVGAFVGDEAKAKRHLAMLGAAARQGQVDAQKTSKQADALVAKLESGQSLTPDELGKLRGCLKMCGHLKKLHDQLHAQTSSTGYHDDKPIKDDFLGAYKSSSKEMTDTLGAHKSSSDDMTDVLGNNVQEILGGEYAMEIMGKSSGYNDILGAAGPTQAQFIALTAVAATQPSKLPAFAKQQGIVLTPADMAKLKVAVNRTKIIMSHPDYKQMQINPKALATVKGDGAPTSDSMGGFGSVFGKILTAPLAAGALAASALSWGVNHVILAPTNLIGKVANWGAKKGGWGNMPGYGGGGAPAPAQPAQWTGYPPGAMPGLPPGMPPVMPAPGLSPQLQAAYQQRQIAAYQAQAAAQAQSDQAQQQLTAAADAANAEADALEAENQARADQQAALQAQYGIIPDGSSGEETDQQEILGTDWFSGYEIEPIPGKEKEVDKAKKITAEAQKNTPTGKKIRAGATLYHKAKKGDPKSRLAITNMEAKAKRGDPQAQRDVNAVKAGKIAIHAKGHALKTISRKSAAEARRKRFLANQKKLEKGMAQRLSEHSRRKQLVKISKVEYRAAHGDKKAQKLITHHVARAKAGDKKAQANVAALKLARHVRTSARTPQDLKRQRQAGKLIAKARHGHKKSIRQIALIHAAAKQGQPNAKRAMKHLQVAAHVERTVSTGKVSLPTSKKAAAQKKQVAVAAQKKKDIVRYEMLKKRVAGPLGTREEALAAAKLGQKLGMKEEAAQLAERARKLRPAGQPIKDAAKVVKAATQEKDPKAIAAMSDAIASADRGEPKGIAAAGKIAAVHGIAAVDAGEPMPKPLAEATLLVEKAQAGDPESKRIIAKAGEAAQDPSHPNHDEAVELAVGVTAASAILAATAGKKSAQTHWRTEARKATGTHVEPDEKAKLKEELDAKVAKLKDGTGTYADGLRAKEIAMALGMAGLAAQISAIMPPADTANPMSSLPERPLPKITGWKSFLVEAVKAITLSTPNPFENYREGVTSRNTTPLLRPLAATAGADGQRGRRADAGGDEDSVKEFATGVKKPELAMTPREKQIAEILKKMEAGDQNATGAVVAVRMAALGGDNKAKAEYQLMLKVARETGFDLEGRMS